jgi:hypothetical protein
MEPSSRPINLYKRVTGNLAPAIYDRLDSIQDDIELLIPGRVQDRQSKEKFRQCLRALCLDLFDAHLSDPHMLVGVRRDNTALTKNPVYPEFVTARQFLRALEGLISGDYIQQVTLGNEGSGKTSRIRATDKLTNALSMRGFRSKDIADGTDPIRLKIGPKYHKKLTPFKDTKDTLRWRDNLNRINENNARYNISLDLDPNKLDALERKRFHKAKLEAFAGNRPLDYQKTDIRRASLHRVFNSTDWAEGGRFYGAWWQSIPREYRQFIRINGKFTCEYDYSSIHLRLLYHQAKQPLPSGGDPYSQPYGPRHRDTVKLAFNVMLNANGRPDPSSVPQFNSDELGVTWRAFLDSIACHHSKIKQFFFTGIGRNLQRADADIAEAVLLKFTDMLQPCLPIHDSFITYEALSDELPEYMEKIAKDHGLPRAPVKEAFTSQYTGPVGELDMDIDKLLQEYCNTEPS